MHAEDLVAVPITVPLFNTNVNTLYNLCGKFLLAVKFMHPTYYMDCHCYLYRLSIHNNITSLSPYSFLRLANRSAVRYK